MNKVVFLKPNIVKISKGSMSVLAVVEDSTVMIISLNTKIDGEQFVPLIKEMKSEEEAYTEFLYLIGKMCSKDIDSKYFGEPVIEEHMLNGNHDLNKIDVYRVTVIDTMCFYNTGMISL